MKKIIFFVLLSILGGCAGYRYSTRTQYEEMLTTMKLTAKEEGFGSVPKNYIDIEKDYIKDLLKDPFSAQFRNISSAAKCYVGKLDWDAAGMYPYKPVQRMCSILEVNAKNSYGGYSGYKGYLIIWKDEKIEMVKSEEQLERGAGYPVEIIR